MLSEYSSGFWKIEDAQKLVDNMDNVLNINLFEFCNTLERTLVERNIQSPIKVYLENTTKVGPDLQGNFDSLYKFCKTHNFPHIGLCLDSEHYYAVEGTFPWDISIIDVPLVYHLNTIPEEVAPKSFKDRHSFTTLSECSLNTLDQYLILIDNLNKNKIPFVREVKEETMFREMEQLQEDYMATDIVNNTYALMRKNDDALRRLLNNIEDETRELERNDVTTEYKYKLIVGIEFLIFSPYFSRE